MSDNNGDVIEYPYSSDTFCMKTKHWDDGVFEYSEFDKLLRRKWDGAMEAGYFRYHLDKLETKFIGEKKYVAQLNVKRATERRKPQEILLVNQPFDPNVFNFKKIKPEEILFRLSKQEDKDGSTNNKVKNLVMVNVSPLEYGHVLLVPDIDALRPQVLTKYAIQSAIETILLSRHQGFKVGFNSLCAYSSVNHQHFHAYYLEHELYIESCHVKQLKGIVYELEAMPCKGFAFQLHSTTIEELSKVLFLFCDYLQKSEIAHNLLLMRGTVFGKDRDSKEYTVRIFLWPRKKFVGAKEEAAFNVAVVELGGHLPIKMEDMFADLTEEYIESTINSASLEDQEYSEVREKLLQIYSQHSS